MKFAAGIFILAACLLYPGMADDDSDNDASTTTWKHGASSPDADATASDDDDIVADISVVDGSAEPDASSAETEASDDETEADTSVVTTDLESDNDAATADDDENTIKNIFGHENRIICVCPLRYDPVCGSNGITYSNECILRCISKDLLIKGGCEIRPVYRGQCRALACKCPEIYKPVCGTDNQTYTNACYLACENARREKVGQKPIAIAYRSICSKPACKCPDCIIPVCGTDGKTYRNICVLQCYSRLNQAKGLPAINVKCSGACKKEICYCPLIKNEICGSDNNTYYNKCYLDCQNRRRNQLGLDLITVRHPGQCNKCNCPLKGCSVCASDGNTYFNYCFLKCANQKRKCTGLPELTVQWLGPCNCGCTKEWDPICTTNLMTWANRCLLDCENRRRLKNGLPLLTKLHNGECKKCNCSYCSKYYSPVCGSDRQTYHNMCVLNCNSDCRIACQLPPIWKVADKKCNC